MAYSLHMRAAASPALPGPAARQAAAAAHRASRLPPAAGPTNADRNVGQTAEVIAAVEPARPGRARLSGVDWAARCDVPLAEGQLAEVVAVEGTTLVLRPSAGSSTRAV